MGTKKKYSLPLSEKDKEELSKVYESIYLKAPHHNLLDENLIKAIAIHKPEYGQEETIEDAQDSSEENKPENVEEDSKETEEAYQEAVEQFIANYGTEPNKKMTLEAINLANQSYNEAKAKTPNDAPKKGSKGKRTRPNLIKITNGNEILNVNPQTFEMFLSKQGWERYIDKPKELNNE